MNEKIIKKVKNILNDESAKVFIEEYYNTVEINTHKRVDFEQVSALKKLLRASKCEVYSYTYDGATTGTDSWLVIFFKGVGI